MIRKDNIGITYGDFSDLLEQNAKNSKKRILKLTTDSDKAIATMSIFSEVFQNYKKIARSELSLQNNGLVDYSLLFKSKEDETITSIMANLTSGSPYNEVIKNFIKKFPETQSDDIDRQKEIDYINSFKSIDYNDISLDDKLNLFSMFMIEFSNQWEGEYSISAILNKDVDVLEKNPNLYLWETPLSVFLSTYKDIVKDPNEDINTDLYYNNVINLFSTTLSSNLNVKNDLEFGFSDDGLRYEVPSKLNEGEIASKFELMSSNIKHIMFKVPDTNLNMYVDGDLATKVVKLPNGKIEPLSYDKDNETYFYINSNNISMNVSKGDVAHMIPITPEFDISFKDNLDQNVRVSSNKIDIHLVDEDYKVLSKANTQMIGDDIGLTSINNTSSLLKESCIKGMTDNLSKNIFVMPSARDNQWYLYSKIDNDVTETRLNVKSLLALLENKLPDAQIPLHPRDFNGSLANQNVKITDMLKGFNFENSSIINNVGSFVYSDTNMLKNIDYTKNDYNILETIVPYLRMVSGVEVKEASSLGGDFSNISNFTEDYEEGKVTGSNFVVQQGLGTFDIVKDIIENNNPISLKEDINSGEKDIDVINNEINFFVKLYQYIYNYPANQDNPDSILLMVKNLLEDPNNESYLNELAKYFKSVLDDDNFTTDPIYKLKRLIYENIIDTRKNMNIKFLNFDNSQDNPTIKTCVKYSLYNLIFKIIDNPDIFQESNFSGICNLFNMYLNNINFDSVLKTIKNDENDKNPSYYDENTNTFTPPEMVDDYISRKDIYMLVSVLKEIVEKGKPVIVNDRLSENIHEYIFFINLYENIINDRQLDNMKDELRNNSNLTHEEDIKKFEAINNDIKKVNDTIDEIENLLHSEEYVNLYNECKKRYNEFKDIVTEIENNDFVKDMSKLGFSKEEIKILEQYQLYENVLNSYKPFTLNSSVTMDDTNISFISNGNEDMFYNVLNSLNNITGKRLDITDNNQNVKKELYDILKGSFTTMFILDNMEKLVDVEVLDGSFKKYKGRLIDFLTSSKFKLFLEKNENMVNKGVINISDFKKDTFGNLEVMINFERELKAGQKIEYIVNGVKKEITLKEDINNSNYKNTFLLSTDQNTLKDIKIMVDGNEVFNRKYEDIDVNLIQLGQIADNNPALIKEPNFIMFKDIKSIYDKEIIPMYNKIMDTSLKYKIGLDENLSRDTLLSVSDPKAMIRNIMKANGDVDVNSKVELIVGTPGTGKTFGYEVLHNLVNGQKLVSENMSNPLSIIDVLFIKSPDLSSKARSMNVIHPGLLQYSMGYSSVNVFDEFAKGIVEFLNGSRDDVINSGAITAAVDKLRGLAPFASVKISDIDVDLYLPKGGFTALGNELPDISNIPNQLQERIQVYKNIVPPVLLTPDKVDSLILKPITSSINKAIKHNNDYTNIVSCLEDNKSGIIDNITESLALKDKNETEMYIRSLNKIISPLFDNSILNISNMHYNHLNDHDKSLTISFEMIKSYVSDNKRLNSIEKDRILTILDQYKDDKKSLLDYMQNYMLKNIYDNIKVSYKGDIKDINFKKYEQKKFSDIINTMNNDYLSEISLNKRLDIINNKINSVDQNTKLVLEEYNSKAEDINQSDKVLIKADKKGDMSIYNSLKNIIAKDPKADSSFLSKAEGIFKDRVLDRNNNILKISETISSDIALFNYIVDLKYKSDIDKQGGNITEFDSKNYPYVSFRRLSDLGYLISDSLQTGKAINSKDLFTYSPGDIRGEENYTKFLENSITNIVSKINKEIALCRSYKMVDVNMGR